MAPTARQMGSQGDHTNGRSQDFYGGNTSSKKFSKNSQKISKKIRNIFKKVQQILKNFQIICKKIFHNFKKFSNFFKIFLKKIAKNPLFGIDFSQFNNARRIFLGRLD